MKLLKKIKRIFINPEYAELLMNRTELLRRVLLYKDQCYGTFIGTDKFGNRYYHNSESQYGRNRFVIHYYQSMFYVEPTQIDPEWFRWLHYTTDIPPKSYHLTGKPYLKPQGHETGNRKAYIPYSTTLDKIKSWDGKLVSDMEIELKRNDFDEK